MKKNKITIFLLSFFILLAAVFSVIYYNAGKKMKQSDLTIMTTPGDGIRQFSFLNQEGQEVTRDVMEHKVAVVEFFFTTCKGICPKMNENMAKVYQAFRSDDEVIILSHTVDPKRDSVAAMKAYSLRYDADPKRWMFLTGDKKALYDQARNSYKVSAGDTSILDIESDFIHTNVFVLVDKEGRLRVRLDKKGNPEPYDGTNEKSVAQLIEDIRQLKQEN